MTDDKKNQNRLSQSAVDYQGLNTVRQVSHLSSGNGRRIELGKVGGCGWVAVNHW